MKALYNEATLDLQTPEGMAFSLPLAGPVSRLLALWLDMVIVMVAGGMLQKVLAVVSALSPDAAQAAITVLFFAVSLLYGIVMEWVWQGQTVGKRLLGIRVMDRDGLPIHVSQIVVRNLLRPVDMLPLFYLVGGVTAMATRYGQRIGDLAANTVVVRTRRTAPPDWQKLLAGKFNSMLEHPHLAARLRQRVTPELAGVALDALARREELDDTARIELFRELAGRLRALVEFPAETVEALSDEQYVRNAVEIVFRSR
ncbi:MAG TPA: RDD family protein [Bryobacteraceae bacterium]|nr:RDD family protein [Bryobacteraceae bacterium]